MAKTYNNLFAQVYDFEALYRAYLRARRGKRHLPEVQQFEQHLEGNLIQLQNELIWNTYHVGRYRFFSVYEPKEREIAALPFRDRIVQHALVAVIEPVWERRFIHDSYACRVGKGTHKGADRAQQYLREVKRRHGRVYVLKADIAKYFHSIDHDIAKRIVARHIKCKRTLALLFQIIDSMVEINGNLFGVGIHIGSLTSQLIANIYLHELDLFVKHALREHYYVRYMDDFLIVHHDKRHLQRLRAVIEEYLWDRLRLRVNVKTQVFPVGLASGRAVDFLGYRIWPTHRRVRKSSICRIKHTMRRLGKQFAGGFITLERIRQSIRSWIAHTRHAQSYGLRRAILRASFSRTGE